jgi:hypothetical protein
MQAQAQHDFGAEVRRSFEVHDNCFGCAAFYEGCAAWPKSRAFACADYYPLPTVGMNGQTGQQWPASRMGSRKQPRTRTGPATTGAQSGHAVTSARQPTAKREHAMNQGQPQSNGSNSARRQSPMGNHGPNGERLCGCGATLKKRQRCCEDCRLRRRQEAVRRWKNRKQPSEAARSASDLPTNATGTHSTHAGSVCDN